MREILFSLENDRISYQCIGAKSYHSPWRNIISLPKQVWEDTTISTDHRKYHTR